MTSWRADERYTALVSERGGALLRLAVLMTGNVHDAEDVVQDVLIAAASAWPVAQPMAYLKRAVANRCIDLIRKRRDVLTDAPPERAVDDAGYLRHDETRAFVELVRSLPERQRAVVVLRYQADLDDRTIARMLDISIHTVRSQAQHAFATLRAQLGSASITIEEDA